MTKWILVLAAAWPLGVKAAAPYCPCHDPPPLPGAKPWKVESTASKACDVVTHWACLPGYTIDGSTAGQTNFTLTCTEGRWEDSEVEGSGCAPVGGDEAHCKDANCRRGPSCQLDAAWKQESLFPADGCEKGREGGASCNVWCAEGYKQATSDRYTDTFDISDQVPVTLICNGNGTFQKAGSPKPPVCKKGRDGLFEFDVYALLWQNESGTLLHPTGEPLGPKGLPSNLNVFDLEGLLSYLYTEVHTGQQNLAALDFLSRDRESGEYIWTGSDGRRKEFKPDPVQAHRDNLNTVVWYRLQVQQPEKIPQATKYEFGTFANFVFGMARSPSAVEQFTKYGAVVGVNPQGNGLARSFEVTQEGQDAGTTVRDCNDAKRRSRLPASRCKAVYNTRSDPRYGPSGRFNAFSLPGDCPNKDFNEKEKSEGTCAQMEGGSSAVVGGLCDGTPDGKLDCTYSLREIARVPLDSVTGVGDLRKFQLNCRDESLRKGVKIDGTELRECVEYAVEGDGCSKCYQDCGVSKNHTGETIAFDVQGDNVTCAVSGASCESSIPFFRGRCDPDSNLKRVGRLRKALLKAAKQQPKPVEILQDCSRHKDCRPDKTNRQLGLNYCERDSSGLCSACYIPGTRKFDLNRASTSPCREDLFTSGGYRGTKGPWAPVCGDGEEGLACWKYLLRARKSAQSTLGWQFNDTWSSCSVSCGQGFRHREASCPNTDSLGSCRRELGDPSNGYCDSTGCRAIENCDGESCPWIPFCSEDTPSGPCMSSKWSPLIGSCSEAARYRYKRCNFYTPEGNVSQYCSENSPPGAVVETELLSAPSRLQYCTSCGKSGGCSSCAGLFEITDGKCVNKGHFVEIKLSISMLAKNSDSFRSRSFSSLDALVRSKASASNAWDSGSKAHLVDAYTYTTTTTTTTTLATTTTTQPTSLRTTTTTTPAESGRNSTTTQHQAGNTTTTTSNPATNTTNSSNTTTHKPQNTTTTSAEATTTTIMNTTTPQPTTTLSNHTTTSPEAPQNDTNGTNGTNSTAPARALAVLAEDLLLEAATMTEPEDGTHEHWMLVVAVSLDPASAGRKEADLKEMAAQGAADLAWSLGKELKEQVSVVKDSSLFCPDLQPWGGCAPAPKEGGLGFWGWLLRILLGLAAIALLVGGAWMLVRLKKDGRCCATQQPGVEMQARA